MLKRSIAGFKSSGMGVEIGYGWTCFCPITTINIIETWGPKQYLSFWTRIHKWTSYLSHLIKWWTTWETCSAPAQTLILEQCISGLIKKGIDCKHIDKASEVRSYASHLGAWHLEPLQSILTWVLHLSEVAYTFTKSHHLHKMGTLPNKLFCSRYHALASEINS